MIGKKLGKWVDGINVSSVWSKILQLFHPDVLYFDLRLIWGITLEILSITLL